MRRPPTSRRGDLRAHRHPVVFDTLESRRLLSGSTGTGTTLGAYGQLPLSFEANQGQSAGQVQFLSRGAGYALFVTPTGSTLSLQTPAASGSSLTSGTALKMKLVGANPTPVALGQDQLPGVSNYLIGSDPSHWQTNVANYAQVVEQGVYPGVDLSYHGNRSQLEYDFTVAPGINPGVIRLSFQGAESTTLDASGNLVLHTASGDVVEQAPVLYQESGGARQPVSGHFQIGADGTVGFAVGTYDATRALVIDPTLDYSTELGNTQSEARGIAVDAEGDAYVEGFTSDNTFPTTPGAFETTNLDGNPTNFVTKLNSTGTALVYSTYLSGTNGTGTFESAISVDGSGDAFVAGGTSATDFPTTTGAFQTKSGGSYDCFVVKLNPAGSGLIYGTYIGGDQADDATGIAVDTSGNAYITGNAQSTNYPTTLGAFQITANVNGTYDAFVTKLNAAGSALLYSSYLGGEADDFGYGIAVDGAGDAFVTGRTTSQTFPTTPGAFQSTPNSLNIEEAFVTEFNPTGSALIYSTYFGGNGSTEAFGIALDSVDDAYVTGDTTSINFPTTPGAFQTTTGGFGPAFVTKFNPTGSSLVYSTLLGGSGGEQGGGIAVDAAGEAFVVGTTSSTDFPTLNPVQATQPSTGQNVESAFFTKLNSAGSGLIYSSYLGGSGLSEGKAIALDLANNPILSGYTSTTFPTTPGAFQTTGGTVFITKIIPSVQFTAPTFTVNETAGSFLATITRTGDLSTVASVDFATSDGTGIQGVDYQAVRQTLTFGVGVASLQVTIPILDPIVVAPSTRTVNLTLSNPVGNLGIGAPGSVVLTIREVPAALTPTGTTVTPSITYPILGQLLTFRATVVPSPGATGTPAGTVTFLDGTTPLLTVPLDATGHAFYSTAALGLGQQNINAVYSGDALFSPSSGTNFVEVQQIPTTTTITAAPNPATLGQSPISLTFRVVDPQGNVVPSGIIASTQNLDPGVMSNFVPIINGLGRISVQEQYAGTFTFNADYQQGGPPDGPTPVYGESAATPITVMVKPFVTISNSLVRVGQPITFSAIVSISKTEFDTSARWVVFTIDGVAQPPIPVTHSPNEGDAAYLTVSDLSVGTHEVVATYSGSPQTGTGPSMSDPVSATVYQPVFAPSTTTVQATPNPVVAGQPVTLTAVVFASGLAVNPPPFVTFTINGVAQPPVVPVFRNLPPGEGMATLTVPSLPPGTNYVGAAYSGDPYSLASVSSVVTVAAVPPQPASPIATITTLTASSSQIAQGQSVTFTATVTPALGSTGAPTGSVAFMSAGNLLGDVPLTASGQAILATTTLPLGTLTITAVYSGDAAFTTSTATTPLTVLPAAPPVLRITTTTVTPATFSMVPAGQPVTFTATVTPVPTSTTAPSGTVTFFDGTTTLGSAPLDASGRAAFTTAYLGNGPQFITAVYNGSTLDATSSGVSAEVVVTNNPMGPAPLVVSLHRFGYHLLPTTLVLTCNSPLDPGSATDLGNYRITDAQGRSISVTSATYDPATNSVTLHPSHRLNIHWTYHLVVFAVGPVGVMGANGQLLDGANNGRPGSNYTAVINRATLVLPANFTPATAHRAVTHAATVPHPRATVAAKHHARRAVPGGSRALRMLGSMRE